MKFYCDAMLARLGRWLRMLGYDTQIAEVGKTDSEVLSSAKGSILLTRDKLLAHKARERKQSVHYIENKKHVEQLRELVGKEKLKLSFPDETRCPMCNGMLRMVERSEVEAKVPPKVKSDVFWTCDSCGKVYWRGAHWDQITEIVESLKKSA